MELGGYKYSIDHTTQLNIYDRAYTQIKHADLLNHTIYHPIWGVHAKQTDEIEGNVCEILGAPWS